MSQSFSPTYTLTIKREKFLDYSVLWCPTCGKTYIRHIIDASITSYICKCNNHLMKLIVDPTIVGKVLDEKGTSYLSKENLVGILV